VVQVSDVSGDILLSAGPLLILFDVNGHILAAVHTGSHILSSAMAEVREWMDGRCMVTGHVDGMIRVWSVEYWDDDHRRALEAAVAAQDHDVPSLVDTFLREAMLRAPYMLQSRAALDWHQTPVTALHVTSRHLLLSGDAAGNVVEWLPPEEA
jgi:hypothetical protein